MFPAQFTVRLMAEERYEKFAWGGSEPWQDHLRNIYPSPTLAQIIKIKRKWYQKHIDPELSIDPPSSVPPSSNASQAPQPPRPPRQATASRGSGFWWLPALLFCLWPYAWLIGKSIPLSIAAFTVGVFSKYGIPRLNMDFWRTVATDDDMHSVVYCLLLLLVFPEGLAIQLPILLGAACWVVSGMVRVDKFPALQNYAKSVNMYSLASLKSDCEVALGLFSLLSIATPNGSFVLALLLWQFLRMKYMLSTLTQGSFAKLRMYGDALLGGGMLGTVWDKVKKFGGYMVSVEQGQASCSVM